MFDPASPPSVSDRFSDVLYKLRRIDRWSEAVATAYSSEWVPPGRWNPGHYIVTFSYEAAGEMRSGSFLEDGDEESVPYARGDTFTIRWNPRHPNQAYTFSDNGPNVLRWGNTILGVFIVLIAIIFGSG